MYIALFLTSIELVMAKKWLSNAWGLLFSIGHIYSVSTAHPISLRISDITICRLECQAMATEIITDSSHHTIALHNVM